MNATKPKFTAEITIIEQIKKKDGKEKEVNAHGLKWKRETMDRQCLES